MPKNENKDSLSEFIFSYKGLKDDSFKQNEEPDIKTFVCSFCGKTKSKKDFAECGNGINLCITCYKNKDYC